LRLEKPGGTWGDSDCWLAEEDAAGAKAEAETAAVEWRKQRREMGVMRGKDGAEGGGVSRSECGRGEAGKGRRNERVEEWKKKG